MLVYGDHVRAVDVARTLAAPAGDPTADFIALSELAQGLLDAEFEARGCDDLTPLHAAAVADLRARAARIAAAWDGRPAPPPPVAALTGLALPQTVKAKTAEGHAFYAVYPEAYLEAARAVGWAAPPFVLGLRSIGLGLAAMVAEGAGAAEVVSLRPVGPPFRRELRIAPGLRARLAAHAGPFAVVDEGPGLSGSSFGAVLDLLEGLGVGRERIVVFPSHAGDPGPEASAAHRARWAGLRKAAVDFPALAARRPLPTRFEDVTGPVHAVEDLSGGAWRAGRPLPAFPRQERLKFRLRTASGDWLVRFAGLGAAGEAKLARARALHAAGWGPEAAALRWGFLLLRWVDGAPARPRPDELAGYLAFRASLEGGAGASLDELADMVRVNAGELGLDVRAQVPAVTPRPVQVDARLHAWEWLRTAGGRLLKTDALDHACAHDLVGCQDIAWDVAGAAVELGLSEPEVRALAQAAGADMRLVAFHRLAYPAFQAGLWTFAGETAEVARYRAALDGASRAAA
ncbi:conserved hypothetical protein [Phenylobacterium zucineum HLK1]|uniref:Uncharacterized protein n=1 Tax=Phenylobacterium zucineum (strain HLK1) TaxID=450851 RepID=B4RE72_PHEZH|nr:hypothetical protein [Phenylobacterium zucineum]ACG78505.1 conserved hypothetical protein [Phenylobacterium zucineum HLK1]